MDLVSGRGKPGVGPGSAEGSTTITEADLIGSPGGAAVWARPLDGSNRTVGAEPIATIAEAATGVEMAGLAADVDVAGQLGEPPSDACECRQIDGLGDGVETQAAHEHTSGVDDH